MNNCLCIVVFNISNLLELQIDLWRRFVSQEIKVIDNSALSHYEVSRELKRICKIHEVEYLKTGFYDKDFSKSHGWACNVAYNLFRHEYEVIGLIDHDIFPYTPVDLSFMHEYDLCGIPQTREEFVYLWPGLCFINSRLGHTEFMPGKIDRLHLDTGQGTYIHIKNGAQVKYLDEEIVPFEDDSYSIIGQAFLHMRNGSNWRNDPNHGEKIGKLIQILNSKL